MARFKRLDGYDVFFLTGTDEHGMKIAQTAEKEGLAPKELVDRNAEIYKVGARRPGHLLDRFIRTTDADHYEASQAHLEADGSQRGHLPVQVRRLVFGPRRGVFTSRTRPWSRTTASATPRETGHRGDLDGRGELLLPARPPTRTNCWRSTRPTPNSAPRSPASTRSSASSRRGLEDLSISRTTFDWGVPVPGNDKHVMYVWVDALTNYLTGVGYPDIESESFRKFWPADVHVIGKDISRFHAIYWPAFLMSAGLELPKRIMIHGFLQNNGVKMSKSLGNVVAPADFVAQYGLDQVRYFLLREVPFGADGNYNHEAIVGRMNSDLANNFGNLAQRSLSMVAKNCEGRVPVPGGFSAEDAALLGPGQRAAGRCPRRVRKAGVQPRAGGHLERPGRHQRLLRRAGPVGAAEDRRRTHEHGALRDARGAADRRHPGPAGHADGDGGHPAHARPARRGRAPVRRPGTPIVAGTELPAPAPVFPKYEEPAEA